LMLSSNFPMRANLMLTMDWFLCQDDAPLMDIIGDRKERMRLREGLELQKKMDEFHSVMMKACESVPTLMNELKMLRHLVNEKAQVQKKEKMS